MNPVWHHAGRAFRVVTAVGSGIAVACLGAPDPTIEPGIASFPDTSDVRARLVLAGADLQRPGARAFPTTGWTGTLTLDGTGFRLPVRVVDRARLPVDYAHAASGGQHAA